MLIRVKLDLTWIQAFASVLNWFINISWAKLCAVCKEVEKKVDFLLSRASTYTSV